MVLTIVIVAMLVPPALHPFIATSWATVKSSIEMAMALRANHILSAAASKLLHVPVELELAHCEPFKCCHWQSVLSR